MHYRNVVRIDKAKLLLADRALTVDDVAERVGFADPKYFARVFEDQRGMSPSVPAGQRRRLNVRGRVRLSPGATLIDPILATSIHHPRCAGFQRTRRLGTVGSLEETCR